MFIRFTHTEVTIYFILFIIFTPIVLSGRVSCLGLVFIKGLSIMAVGSVYSDGIFWLVVEDLNPHHPEH